MDLLGFFVEAGIELGNLSAFFHPGVVFNLAQFVRQVEDTAADFGDIGGGKCDRLAAGDRLHERDFDVAIVNAGGLTHTSVALRDALLAVERPFIEVHLSDPSTREAFRQVNFLADIALVSIVGHGARGYPLALERIAADTAESGRDRGSAAGGWRRGVGRAGRPRRSIDALDRRIVKLLNERAELARGVGRAKVAAGRRGIRDIEREREILLRIAMANAGPMPQADLLALYRRLFSATRALEAADRRRVRPASPEAGDD